MIIVSRKYLRERGFSERTTKSGWICTRGDMAIERVRRPIPIWRIAANVSNPAKRALVQLPSMSLERLHEVSRMLNFQL